MPDAHTAYHLFSIFAVVGYDEYRDIEYTRSLHNMPILATFDEITLIGDALTSEIDGVTGINYDGAYCSRCEHCKFDMWIPHHPLFKCDIDGKMNARTQETIQCPCPDKGSDILERMEIDV